MKRTIAWTVCLMAILLASCGQKAPAPAEETTIPSETTVATEPTETEPPAPEMICAEVLVDEAPVILVTLDRGTQVDVVGDYDEDHWVVKLETGYGLVEKRLLCMEEDAPYEQWTGYARYGALFYTDYHQSASTAQKLSTNTKLLVLDAIGDLYIVEREGIIGYVSAEKLGRSPSRSKSGGSGGGGGGSSYGADGGDIALSWRGGVMLLAAFVPQSGEPTGKASVLADSTEVLLGWYDRGEMAQIVTQAGFALEKQGYHTVYLEGLYGYIRQDLLQPEGEEAYAQWEGYARYGSQLFGNFYLNGEPLQKLPTNTKVQVLCQLEGCCLVLVDEELGYLETAKISQTRITSKPGGGGGGGGGGSQEWSDPVL